MPASQQHLYLIYFGKKKNNPFYATSSHTHHLRQPAAIDSKNMALTEASLILEKLVCSDSIGKSH